MNTPVEMSQAPSIGAGRDPAGRAVRAWLTDVLRPRLCVVTGAPGSGKSHLTAWAALSDTGPVRAVHAMLSARGMTLHGLAWALAEQLSVPGRSPETIVANIAADRRPATIVISELDESGPACDGASAAAIITELLNPLLDTQHVRLLTEGRAESLAAFTVPAEVVHLDDPAMTDRAAFTAWLRANGRETAPAEALFPNVGLAELALLAGASENVPERWLAQVPPDAVPAIQVLASAYGLVEGTRWTALTAALTGDVQRAQASVALAAPLVTRVDDGFQLALRPLREAVLRTRTPQLAAQIEHALGRALYEQVPKDSGGVPQWARSDPYTTTHLLRHAAATGVADRLVEDAGQLVHADPRAATAVLETLETPLWPTWRAVGRGLMASSDPAERASLLTLSARLRGDDSLTGRFAPHASWHPGWCDVGGDTWTGPVSALVHRDGALLVATADGALHILNASTGAPVGRIAGGTPDIWGLVWLSDGSVLHLDAHRAVRASAVTKSESRADRISGLLNDAGPVTAGTVRDTLKTWPGLTALGASADLSHFVAGDTSGQVHVWPANAPQQVRSHRLHQGPVTAVAGVHGRSGRLSVISGGADGTVRLWPVAEAPIDEPMIRRNTGVTAAAFAVLPSGPVAAVAWTDGHLRIWDLLDGEEQIMNPGLTVNALALTPEGLLAVAGPHGTATLRITRPGSSPAPR
ncbi:hypothetical protein [Actinomadura decatromicini]|uniref:Uncharacterized protein n=1 Tax=Actinomadura decatromicini TaxID=2604572 RepID=A0A5D3FGE9_9ACTN|nr:hypothetical protein [Actinomadura decatromicini]TYK46926.1 hypothetical protein FXF68_24195 [Actinomadura decatromicini]